MHLKVVIVALGLLGLIPFIVPVFALSMDFSIYSLSPSIVFVTYSCIILTFLAGSLWGQIVADYERNTDQGSDTFKPFKMSALAIVTNLVALACWFTLLSGALLQSQLLLMLTFGFVLILWIESSLKISVGKWLGNRYLKLRWFLTIVVCACHLNVIYLL
jgi:hypothetical protein